MRLSRVGPQLRRSMTTSSDSRRRRSGCNRRRVVGAAQGRFVVALSGSLLVSRSRAGRRRCCLSCLGVCYGCNWAAAWVRPWAQMLWALGGGLGRRHRCFGVLRDNDWAALRAGAAPGRRCCLGIPSVLQLATRFHCEPAALEAAPRGAGTTKPAHRINTYLAHGAHAWTAHFWSKPSASMARRSLSLSTSLVVYGGQWSW